MRNLAKFPDLESVELKHKDLLLNYFKSVQPVISELNFVEMFAWRKLKKICITEYKNNIVLFLEKDGQKYFYPPFSHSTDKIIIELLEYFKSLNENIKVRAYPDDLLHLLDNIMDKIILEDDRDNYDYVYLTEDLINLTGRKYDGKRNNIKKFLKNYKYEFLPLTDEIIADCIKFQEKWCNIRNCPEDLSLKNESYAVMEILNNFNKLPCFGAVLKIGDSIEGYTIASELNNETGEVIVEKANPEFYGIYQAINQMFSEKFLKKYKYVNRQQDTGDLGLRKAKLSYQPFKLLKKYNIGIKNGNN